VYCLIVVAAMHQACKLQYLSRAVACALSLSLSSRIARARALSLSLSFSRVGLLSGSIILRALTHFHLRSGGVAETQRAWRSSMFLFLSLSLSHVSFFLSFSFSRTLSRSFTFSRTALRRCRGRGGRRRAGADWRVVRDVGLSCKSAQT